MASDTTTVGTEGSKTFRLTPSQETPTPPTPGQEKQGNEAKQLSSSLTDEGQKSTDQVAIRFAAEMEALKLKILELEKQIKRDSAVRTSDGDAQDPAGPKSIKTPPNQMFDSEQYKRMEKFLYKHRKEWEIAGGPSSFDTRFKLEESDPYEDATVRRRPRRPRPELSYYEQPRPSSYFARPSLYANYEPPDQYERPTYRIPYMEPRKAKEEKAKREDKAKVDGHSTRSTYAQLRLNRVDWFAFKRLSQMEEKDSSAIDILIGEPIIDDNIGTEWYVPLGRRARKAIMSQYLQTSASLAPGQAPLPERIRIHSALLRKILAKILGSDASDVVGRNLSAVVLVRPFKALFYREQALRSWCTSLEKKFQIVTEPTEHGFADAINPDQGSGSTQSDNLSQVDNVHEKTTDVPQSIMEDVKDKNQEKNGKGQHKLEDDCDSVDNEDDEEKEEKEDPNDETRSTIALGHLKCLLSFMDSYVSTKQAYLNSPECIKVFFSDLWYLFRPGAVVIGRDGKQAYRVVNVTSTRHRVVPSWETWFWNSGDKKKKAPFSITCVYVDFDGKNLGPVSKTFDFKRFDGEMDVVSLPIYPLRFHPLRKVDFSDTEWKEFEQLPPEKKYLQKLINRGTKFLEVVGIKAMYYAGPTVGIRDDVESQVVIDFETAFSVDDKKQQEWMPHLDALLGNPESENAGQNDNNTACKSSCCRDEIVHNDTYVDLKTREDYINGLLPKRGSVNEQPSIAIIPQTLGELRKGPGKNDYAISDDERVIMSYPQLDLSYLTNLHPSKVPASKSQETESSRDNKGIREEEKTAFGRLVLEQGQKPMIQALVAQHFRDKESKTNQTTQVDIVKGKGKGLILLLHGAPGVGKTSTAGDLGSTAKEVEKALDINFTLANRWDCILLLDEADVFLAQRNKEDFMRNGLVAVFLRVLEYYAGVLFLTTNRVGDFDEAFTSRIHVSLYYPELNEKKTVEIFRINMKMIKERFEDQKRTIFIEDILTFASDHYNKHPAARWNGRQIRNACQTALALAEFEAQGNSHETVQKPDAYVELKVSHFQIVQKAYLEFAHYMTSLYGSTSSTRAKESKVRAIWVDENDNVVGMDGAFKSRKEAFLLASQKQQQPYPVQPQLQPQQLFQQQAPLQSQQGFQQQPFPIVNQGIPNSNVQQYYQYSNVAMPQPMYPQAQSPMQMQTQPAPQLSPNQLWNVPGLNVTSGLVTGQGEGQNRPVSQPPTTPPAPSQQQHQKQQQQQLHENPGWFGQNIQAMYSANGQQGSDQRPSNDAAFTGGGGYPPGPSPPGQQWQGLSSNR